MSTNLQDVLMRALMGGGQPQAPQQPTWPQANDFGMSDPSVHTPPEDFIVSPQPSQPRPAETRMEGYRRLLTNFTYTLGAGLEAASANPTGRAQRTQAGMGAILQMPQKLQAIQEAKQIAEQQRQRQEQVQTAQTANILSEIQNRRATLAETQRLRSIEEGRAATDAANITADNTRQDIAAADKLRLDAEAPLSTTPIEDETGQYLPYRNPKGGDPILKRVAGPKPRTEAKPNEDQLIYADYQKHPDLMQKYGSDMVGFAKWKAAETNARNAQTGELNPQQLIRVTTLASQFDTNPTVKGFNESANKYQLVRTLLKGKMGGPADLALVYEFMKGLDPTSVVRESEYESAAKSGNIFAGTLARFNGYLKPEGGFLPEEVKSAFEQILKQKVDVTSRQVKGMYDDFGRRIDLITGKPGAGKDWLTDYTSILGESSAAKTIEQFSPSTKQYRHSTDGGKTWTAGRAQ